MTNNQLLSLKPGDKVMTISGKVLVFHWKALDRNWRGKRWAVAADSDIGERFYMWHTDLSVMPKR